MLYYFYCPKCGHQEYHTEKPLHGCIPNIRDGHGYPIYHYPCPKCKNEYREGFTVCADCGVQLVESLDDGDMVPLIFGKNEHIFGEIGK